MSKLCCTVIAMWITFGGAEGAIDRNDVADPSLSVDKQLASGKTVILAPKGF